MGSKKPLLINCVKKSFEHADLCAVLGALDAAHRPLEVREQRNLGLLKFEELGIWEEDKEAGETLVKQANAIELGRIVTRDIGGSDPERMSAENVMKYVQKTFNGSSIIVHVIEGQKNFEKDYPCFAAVNRAAACKKILLKSHIILDIFNFIPKIIKLLKDIKAESFSWSTIQSVPSLTQLCSLLARASTTILVVLMLKLEATWLVCTGTNVALHLLPAFLRH